MENQSVWCELSDFEGNFLGSPICLPLCVVPNDLQLIVNQLLSNEEVLPYAFYISDNELLVELGIYLEENKVSVENVVQIVYQPQSIFHTRPVCRLSATIAGHTEAMLAVSFSPDSKHLASGSGDTTVRLWDPNTQTPSYTCTGHRSWVLCIAWSPDAKYLVSGSKSGELIIWDPQTGNLLGTLVGHRRWITEISWEPLHLQAPCQRFVSANKDGDARIWDVVLKRCVMSLSGHTQSVTCVKWGGDGVIYTGSQDCTINVWDPNKGTLIRKLKGHWHWINCMALNTENSLHNGAFDHTNKQYDSPEEMKEAALAMYNKVRGNAPEILASASDDFSVIMYEPLVSEEPKFRLTGHRQLVNDVRFSPDGRWLASASFDKSVRLWNSKTGNFVTVFHGHVGRVHKMSWSPESQFLVSVSSDSTLKVWDIRSRRLVHDLPDDSDEGYAVDWSPDGEKVASGGKDGQIRLYGPSEPAISLRNSFWNVSVICLRFFLKCFFCGGE